MSTPDLIAKYDLLLQRNFIEESTCQSIIDQADTAPSGPATVYGQTSSGGINDRVRRATRFTPSIETTALIIERLMQFKPTVEQHFQASLHDCEEPQFVRYKVGDFFVAHQDGNTGLIRLPTETERKISIVIFLNRQSELPKTGTYCGGSLKFSDYRAESQYREFSLPGEPGLIVAFRAETTHEVLPITDGERYSIVSWYR